MCFLSGIGVAGVCLWHTVPGFSGGVEEVRILEMYLNLREEICMKTVTTKSLDAGTESSDESIAGSLGFVMNEADAEVVEGAAATGEEGDHARSLGMMKKLGRDEQKLGQGAKYVC